MLLGSALTSGESSVLPELLTSSGKPITTAQEWQRLRRPEMLELLRANVYGRAAVGRPEDLRWVVVESDATAMAGTATRKRVEIRFSGPGGAGCIRLLAFIPRATKPVPGFLLCCHRKPENIDPTRQKKMPFWPAEKLVARGYAAITFDVADCDPDKDDHFKNGVHGLFDPPGLPRPADAWGTIAAWAWGASRVMDYLVTDPDLAADRIAVIGHSRGGKAALWAGAEDERFAMVISNDSGCSGAALARGMTGETLRKINTTFPHWFCTTYKTYIDRPEALPLDQHMLLALIAPRLLYVASASEDSNADPASEFRACVAASPAFTLLGSTGLAITTMPPVDQPSHAGDIGYHLRSGKHDLTLADWTWYLDFADAKWQRTR